MCLSNNYGRTYKLRERRRSHRAEYLKAAQNRVVGYGGCFAVGLVTARMLLYKILVNVANRILVLPNYRGNVCPMCQQPTQIH